MKKKIEGASCKIGLRVEFKIKVKVYDWYLICNPPFDTPTCMWKFQSISESSQPKNWMSAVNTRKMLWCIYHVFLSFRGEGDQRLLHQVVTLLLKSVIVDIPRLVGTDSAREPSVSLILVMTLYACLTWIYYCQRGRPWYNKMAATQFKNFLYAFCGKRKTRPVYTERPSKPGSFSFQARKNFPFSVYFPLRMGKNYFDGSWRFHV